MESGTGKYVKKYRSNKNSKPITIALLLGLDIFFLLSIIYNYKGRMSLKSMTIKDFLLEEDEEMEEEEFDEEEE
jgi:hypothetical protein